MAQADKRYLVTYFSQSGSTRKVADAIFAALPEPKEMRPMNELADLTDYRLAFVGFPLWDLGPAPVAADFLRRVGGTCPLALFYTQGNVPDFWQDREVEGRIRAVCAGHIVDRFACQGEVSDALVQMIESNPETAQFAGQAKETKGLPDADALKKAGDFARRLVEEF